MVPCLCSLNPGQNFQSSSLCLLPLELPVSPQVWLPKRPSFNVSCQRLLLSSHKLMNIGKPNQKKKVERQRMKHCPCASNEIHWVLWWILHSVLIFIIFPRTQQNIPKAIIHLPAAVWELCPIPAWCLKVQGLVGGRAGHLVGRTWYHGPSNLWQLGSLNSLPLPVVWSGQSHLTGPL